MKMAELVQASGVPIATIKYYRREGMLPAGDATAANQAEYGEGHVRRLALIRALIEVGGLSIDSARSVIEAIDSEVSLQWVFAAAQHAVSTVIAPATIDAGSAERIAGVTQGWRYSPDNPGLLGAVRAAAAFTGAGQTDERGWFGKYAEAAMLAAEADIDELQTREGRSAQAETVVVGTVLGDALFSGLRRAAQEHVTSVRFGEPSGSES